jgi:hypothetical protein
VGNGRGGSSFLRVRIGPGPAADSFSFLFCFPWEGLGNEGLPCAGLVCSVPVPADVLSMSELLLLCRYCLVESHKHRKHRPGKF